MGGSAELRFGIGLSTAATLGADPVAEAREAEALGFDLLTVSDHLHGPTPSFETWTVLTWAAAATTRILVAPLVLGLPYRPPPVVAKMAESLHRLSEGRLILGLGGGGADAEFAAFGLPVRRPREKVDALEEAIRLIRQLWSEPDVTSTGRYFQAHGAQVEPKPIAPIPIWTGSYGARSLAVTGRLADGWNPSYPFAPPDVVVDKRRQVLRAAEEAGRDPDSITCADNVVVSIHEGAADHPRVVTGGPGQVADRLVDLCHLGFSVLNFWIRGGSEQRERLAHEVLPAVRAALA